MKHTRKMKWLLSGMLISVLLLILTIPAIAAGITRTINVNTGVKVYVDDMPINVGDLHGNPEAFTYNGTTYVAVAAVSNSLGKPVKWDGNNFSVYIGNHSDSEPSVYLTDFDYIAEIKKVPKTQVSDIDSYGSEHKHCFLGSFERIYALNGNYTRLTGSLYQKYDCRSRPVRKGAALEVYGDGKLLYDITLFEDRAPFSPIQIDIPLDGVLELTVRFKNDINAALALGDCALWS